MTTMTQTFRPRRPAYQPAAQLESTPIFDQVRAEHAAKAVAAANTDPEGIQLVAAIHKAKQETTDVRWFGLPWLRMARG